jgi:prepilin-type N-terminal cleavage/methylation domain-containing protein
MEQLIKSYRRNFRAFSLIELVIVIIILAILAAIAIPRVAIGSQRSKEVALQATLAELRQAIEIYGAEHRGYYPAQTNGGPLANVGMYPTFRQHLTWYTRPDGHAVEEPDDEHFLGPYLPTLPVLPVCDAAGRELANVFETFGTPGGSSIYLFGWEYEYPSGKIRANCDETQIGSNGVPYYQW